MNLTQIIKTLCSARLLSKAGPLRQVFIFDGECGFCTVAVRMLARLLQNENIIFIPFQYLSHAMVASLGLCETDCREVAIYIDSKLTVHAGASAFNRLFELAPVIGRMLQVLQNNAHFVRAEATIYGLIARRRGRLSALLQVSRCALIRDGQQIDSAWRQGTQR